MTTCGLVFAQDPVFLVWDIPLAIMDCIHDENYGIGDETAISPTILAWRRNVRHPNLKPNLLQSMR